MSLVDYASSSEEDDDVPEQLLNKPQDVSVSEDPQPTALPQIQMDVGDTLEYSNLFIDGIKNENVTLWREKLGNQLPKAAMKPSSELSMQPESSHSSEPSIETLPDASMLLNSPDFSSGMLTGGNHSSRVAAAMAENASRKRDLKELNSSHPRSKVPKGSLPHSKNVPDTSDGMLVPPQLRGRSNVVTEDISKLFVKKQADPSSG